ncbi:MAG: hypothetical protein Q8L98_03460 [Chlamydiales bacterium]|nr:hypothetical protein [Chlamydiales bacterium]
MNYLRSGLSSAGNLFVETCNSLLPELAYSAVSIGSQDGRVRILIEGALLVAAGIDIIQVSGISKTLNSWFWQSGELLSDDLLSEAVYSAVSVGSQDERVGTILGGLAITTAGLDVIQASRRPAVSELDQQQERVFKRAFRLGGAAVGVAGSCIGISVIALGTLRLLFPDEPIPQSVEYIYEESGQSDPDLDPDVNLQTDCIYPDYLPGCKPECTHSSPQIKNNYPCIPGLHSSLSPITGARAHEFERLRQYPDKEFRLALEDMATMMHDPSSGARDIIHEKDREQATILANEMYSRFLDRYRPYGIHEENAVGWLSLEMCSKLSIEGSQVITARVANKMWTQIVLICEEEKFSSGFFFPEGLTAIHELGHVEETRAGSADEGSELFTVLRDMINLHRIRSQIYGLDPDVEVDYGKNLMLFPRQRAGCRKDEVPLGKFIAFYSKLSRTKQDLAETLLSPESIEFLTSCETEKEESL